MERTSILSHHLQRNDLIICVSGLRSSTHTQQFNTPLSEGRACLCVLPPLGDGRGIRKIPLEMSDIRQFTPVVLLQLSRIVRQGLSLCTAKIVFFSGSILVYVDLVVYLCPDCAAGGMGAKSPY